MRVSHDSGETWGTPLTLAEARLRSPDDRGRQVAYPSATELADGTIAVVWTAISISEHERKGRAGAAPGMEEHAASGAPK